MSTAPAETRKQRKLRTGIVISNKMMKTIVVRVSRQVRHPQYGRVMTQATAFKAHDETNSAAVGDLVTIMETRPLSKDKRWRLVEIVQRASTAPPLPDQPAEETHATHKTAKRATPEAPRP